MTPSVEYASVFPVPLPPATHSGGGSVVTLPVDVLVPLALPGTLSPFTGYAVMLYVVPAVIPLNVIGVAATNVFVPDAGNTPAVGVYVMYTLLNAPFVNVKTVPDDVVPLKLSVPAYAHV